MSTPKTIAPLTALAALHAALAEAVSAASRSGLGMAEIQAALTAAADIVATADE